MITGKQEHQSFRLAVECQGTCKHQYPCNQWLQIHCMVCVMDGQLAERMIEVT